MDIDGRIEIGTPSGSLLDALGELQIAMANTPDEDCGDGRWSADGTTALPPAVVVPEADARRRPAPSVRPRSNAPGAVASRSESASIPSVVDRIATMPRFRSEAAGNHPTGEAWISPRQRQFCERPPV